METVFDELKRYVGWSATDEAALRRVHHLAKPHFTAITEVFYAQILAHDEARRALEGGESQVGRLKHTLAQWLDVLFTGPWDDAYYQRRARIGRLHVRIALPQHYMFGGMNVIRRELVRAIDRSGGDAEIVEARQAVHKILDLELAVMLHTYREDLLAQQARSERLATFGQLVGSIGHELRNPLGVIESSLYILSGRELDERGKKHVQRIGEQVGLANQIISDLLDLIRDRPIAIVPIVPLTLVESALAMLTPPGGVQLSLDGLAGLPSLAGDASKLRQVLVNLITNAIDAVGERGSVRISGRRVGEALELAVNDSGPGVDPAIRSRLFEPLITTKSKGIGLGLALVRRIALRHGGQISYETAPEGGASFVLRLPIAAPAAEGGHA
jgi:signal transduction histidine kinase